MLKQLGVHRRSSTLCSDVLPDPRGSVDYAPRRGGEPLEAELAAQSLHDTAISRLLQASLPVLADEVKAQALKEFDSWLGEVRQMARKVGLSLLEGTLERGVQEEVARQVAAHKAAEAEKMRFTRAALMANKKSQDAQIRNLKERKARSMVP